VIPNGPSAAMFVFATLDPLGDVVAQIVPGTG
jgi:hypothetical protein